MEGLNYKLLQDYIEAQREATKIQTELVGEVSKLNTTLSNGAFDSLKKKLDSLRIAVLGVIVIMATILWQLFSKG